MRQEELVGKPVSTELAVTKKQVAYAKYLGVDVTALTRREASLAIDQAKQWKRVVSAAKVAEKKGIVPGARVSYGWSEEQRKLFFEQRGYGTVVLLKGDGVVVRWDKPLPRGKKQTSVHPGSLFVLSV